jgi:hypothetical protein
MGASRSWPNTVRRQVTPIFALLELAELAVCREQLAEAERLVQRLEAWRFEAPRRLYLALVTLAEGQRSEAVALLMEALDLSRRTGFGFHGPHVLAALACALEPAEEKRRMLNEGEQAIRAGCVGHNQLRFYPLAMRVSFELADYDAVEHHAAALADYTRAEPLPWSEFFIGGGRCLAALGRNRDGKEHTAELGRVRAEGERLGLRTALSEIKPVEA